MTDSRELDITVHGATGYTGALIAEYLCGIAAADPGLKLGLSARNMEKLKEVANRIKAPASVTLIQADAGNPDQMRALAKRSRVVLTAAGPYGQYGEPLVAACAAAGTDYVDLCGEPQWMRRMIDRHQDAARASGARIVFSGAFDSVPSDLGVLLLQTLGRQANGAPYPTVRGRVEKMQGGASGGTVASLMGSVQEAADPEVRKIMISPFGLTPGFEGPRQPSGQKPLLDQDLGTWAAPFVMAVINTKNVHRTNFLTGFAYGADFTYDEMLVTGPGDQGQAIAEKLATLGPAVQLSSKPLKPGEGPTPEEREAGHFTLAFHGATADGQTGTVRVSGDKDPGYGCTSMMISQVALCLLRDGIEVPGGMWTPAAAMGQKLIDRLSDTGVLRFQASVPA